MTATTTGFKKGEFKACVYRNGEPTPSIVKAYLKGNFAIHHPVTGEPTIGEDGCERGADCGGGWVVSHDPTGFSFCVIFNTIRQAKRFVNLLLASNLPNMGKTLGDEITSQWSKREMKKWARVVRKAAWDANDIGR